MKAEEGWRMEDGEARSKEARDFDLWRTLPLVKVRACKSIFLKARVEPFSCFLFLSL